jgi:hypothetical protein
MSEWEKLQWQPFEDVRNNLNEVPPRPSVYAVRCLRKGRTKTIGRTFRDDKAGILCFGRATGEKGLRQRIQSFCNAATGKRSAHAEGERYHTLQYSRKGFPQDSLQIGWLSLSSVQQAKRCEIIWFDQYAEIFGELPPLNRQRG